MKNTNFYYNYENYGTKGWESRDFKNSGGGGLEPSDAEKEFFGAGRGRGRDGDRAWGTGDVRDGRCPISSVEISAGL